MTTILLSYKLFYSLYWTDGQYIIKCDYTYEVIAALRFTFNSFAYNNNNLTNCLAVLHVSGQWMNQVYVYIIHQGKKNTQKLKIFFFNYHDSSLGN